MLTHFFETPAVNCDGCAHSALVLEHQPQDSGEVRAIVAMVGWEYDEENGDDLCPSCVASRLCPDQFKQSPAQPMTDPVANGASPTALYQSTADLSPCYGYCDERPKRIRQRPIMSWPT